MLPSQRYSQGESCDRTVIVFSVPVQSSGFPLKVGGLGPGLYTRTLWTVLTPGRRLATISVPSGYV